VPKRVIPVKINVLRSNPSIEVTAKHHPLPSSLSSCKSQMFQLYF
jgi:hypothetical protein